MRRTNHCVLFIHNWKVFILTLWRLELVIKWWSRCPGVKRGKINKWLRNTVQLVSIRYLCMGMTGGQKTTYPYNYTNLNFVAWTITPIHFACVLSNFTGGWALRTISSRNVGDIICIREQGLVINVVLWDTVTRYYKIDP